MCGWTFSRRREHEECGGAGGVASWALAPPPSPRVTERRGRPRLVTPIAHSRGTAQARPPVAQGVSRDVGGQTSGAYPEEAMDC